MIEYGVLSTMVQNKISMLKGFSDLDEEYFVNNGCREFFKLIKYLNNNGMELSLDFIQEYIESNNLQKMSDALAELRQYPSETYRFDSNLKYLITEKRKRDARLMAEKFWKELQSHNVDIDEAWENMQREFSTVALNSEGVHFQDELKNIELISSARRYPTGITDIDDVIKGVPAGGLIIVGGMTSTGKTSLALQIVMSQKCPVFMVTREMSFRQLATREITAETGIEYDKIELGRLTDSEIEEVKKTQEKLSDGTQIIYYDGSKCTVETICNLAQRFRVTHGIEMVVVDYIQLIQSPKRETREREVAHISRTLKGLALELNIPVIALSQLNRGADVQEKPTLANLRESGALEHDSDMVLLLYREKAGYNNSAWIISIAKNRSGRLGDVKTTFDKTSMKFIERIDY